MSVVFHVITKFLSLIGPGGKQPTLSL